MKYVLMIAAIVLLLWMLFGRSRRTRVQRDAPRTVERQAQMVACAHCGVHLPDTEAQFDRSGLPFCTEAHRIAGPRKPS